MGCFPHFATIQICTYISNKATSFHTSEVLDSISKFCLGNWFHKTSFLQSASNGYRQCCRQCCQKTC